MREIKFRAKVNEKGIDNFWEYGGIIHITERYKDEEDFEECDIWQLINTDGVSFNVDETTIGEYTGLKDKNGKGIYEGDIIKDKDVFYKVIFIDGGFFAKVMKVIGSVGTQKGLEYGIGLILEWNDIEVIGNIYDNPDLLEEVE